MKAPAEALLEAAEECLRNKCIIDGSKCDDVDVARLALAFKLYRAPNSLKLSAIVEAWSMARIVREIY